jgi:hypothetical protein
LQRLGLDLALMTTLYRLHASNNCVFHWTRDLSQWAAIHNMAGAVIRMQMRLQPSWVASPDLEWCSDGTQAGNIVYNPTTHLAVFTVDVAQLAQVKPQGMYFYDCRLEFTDGSMVVLFGGWITWSGITHGSFDAATAPGTNTGDTVTVEGEADNSPVPLPMSITAAVAICQQTAANFGVMFDNWFSSLPTTLPPTAGQYWNNGNTLAKS